MHVGIALRQLRTRRGETVSGLARRLGVARNTVQRWEFGERTPSVQDLGRALAELDASDDEVLVVMRAATGEPAAAT